MQDNNFVFVNILAWLFFIGVLLSIAFSVCVCLYFRKLMADEREANRTEIDKLRESHNQEKRDLLNRIMANSYAEYEAYKIENKRIEHGKPKQINNFLKNSIDNAQRQHEEERLATSDN